MNRCEILSFLGYIDRLQKRRGNKSGTNRNVQALYAAI